MKQASKDLIRTMLAGRIRWITDQIQNSEGDAALLAAQLVELTAALADLVTPEPAPAPTKGDALMTHMSSPAGLNALSEIANAVLTMQGKNGNYAFIAGVRANVADPGAPHLPASAASVIGSGSGQDRPPQTPPLNAGSSQPQGKTR